MKLVKKITGPPIPRWRAPEGGVFYYIAPSLDVVQWEETFSTSCTACNDVGNYFELEEEAEEVAESFRKILMAAERGDSHG